MILLIPRVESTKVEIVPANIKLWDLTKIPDICNWPTAYEAKWKDISSADEIESLLYTYSLPTSQKREKGNRACSPLKSRLSLRFDPFLRYRSGRDLGLDFIHPLIKRG
jgi:hypothetical protein